MAYKNVIFLLFISSLLCLVIGANWAINYTLDFQQSQLASLCPPHHQAVYNSKYGFQIICNDSIGFRGH